MNFFDSILEEFNDLTSGCDASVFKDTTPFKDAVRSQFIMQKECSCELSGTGLNIVTSSSVGESRVVLIGNNLDKIKGECRYARVSLIEMEDIPDEQKAYDTIRIIEFAKYHCFPEGFMTRAEADTLNEGVRVASKSVSQGLRFENAGALLIEKYKANPSVKNAVIYYITDPAFDYKAVAAMAKKNKDILNTLNHIMNSINYDCNSCALKPVCDEVEGLRELHFGKGM